MCIADDIVARNTLFAVNLYLYNLAVFFDEFRHLRIGADSTAKMFDFFSQAVSNLRATSLESPCTLDKGVVGLSKHIKRQVLAVQLLLEGCSAQYFSKQWVFDCLCEPLPCAFGKQ